MFKTIFSLGFIQLIGTGINTVRAKIFAILLGPAGFGVVATIDQLVTSATQFSNLGLPFTAMKFLSHSHSIGEEAYRKSYSVFLKVMTCLTLLATLIAVLVIPGQLKNLDPQLAQYREPVLIALLGIPATTLLIFFVNMLASRQKTIQSISLNTISSIILLIFGAVGCALGGIRGLYLAAVPAATAVIVVMIVFARVKMNLRLHEHAAQPWRELKANSRIIQTAMFTYCAVNSYSAMLLLARYESITTLSEEAAGLLQAALAIALSIGAVLAPANTLYFTPYINRAIPPAEKIEAAHSFLPRLILLYSLGALPVLLFPHLAIQIFFSNRFTDAAAVLPAFVIWQCLFQIANVYQQLLIGLDDVRGYAALTITGNIIATAGSFWLTGQYGLAGIAIAFMAGTVTISVIVALRLHSKYGMAIPKSIYLQLGAAMVGFCGVAMLNLLTPELTLQGIGGRSLTAALFLGGLWVVLPKSLHSELSQGLISRMRLLRGRTSP